jgi:hypothetical protein
MRTLLAPARRSGRRTLVVVSVGIHVAIVFGLFVSGIWEIEKVEAGRMPVDLAYVAEHQDNGSEGAAAPKAEKFKQKAKKEQKKLVTETVQPVEIKKEEKLEPLVTTTGDGDGSGSGSGSGSGRGTGTGSGSGDGSGSGSGSDDCATCGVIERFVPPTVLKGLRISGETQVQPPALTKIEIRNSGKSKLLAVFRVCVGTRGEVSTLTLVKSSGFEAYDSTLTAAMRDWKYKPYLLDGKKPVPVCGMVTFIYAMQ